MAVNSSAGSGAATGGTAPSTVPVKNADPRKTLRKRRLLRIVLAVAVAGLGADGLLFITKKAPSYRSFRDEPARFTVTYPSSWKKYLNDADPNLRAVIISPRNKLDYVEVRVIPTQEAIAEGPLSFIRSFTDGVVSGIAGTVQAPTPLTLNGMPGYSYLYTFTDPVSHQTVAHAHYFLFQGHRMNTLTFQAIPADLTGLKKTWTKILDSFHSEPDAVIGAPASPATTSTPSP